MEGNANTSIGNITKWESLFAAAFVNHYILPDLIFDGRCWINNKISTPKTVINLYISYMLNPWLINLNKDFASNNCLFGSTQLTNNLDPDKYNIVATA